MGRIKHKLTDWEIADAFPEECKKYCRIRLDIAKSQIQEYLWNIERICEEYPDDFERNFFIELNWMFMPKKYKEEYKRMNRILGIVQMRKKYNKKGKLDLNIGLAKSRPIEEMYHFEKAKRTRKNIIALCPFHTENTPSFYIYLDSNDFHCFGCGANGDVIDFVKKLKGLNFVESVKYLLGG